MNSDAASSFHWPEQTFASEVARSQDGDTILFRVSLPLANNEAWGGPFDLRFERREDGTFDLLLRSHDAD